MYLGFSYLLKKMLPGQATAPTSEPAHYSPGVCEPCVAGDGS